MNQACHRQHDLDQRNSGSITLGKDLQEGNYIERDDTSEKVRRFYRAEQAKSNGQREYNPK